MLNAIVELVVVPMLDAGQDLPLGSPITRQFVCHDHAGHVGEPLEELSKERLRGCLVPPALHGDIEHMAVLIDGLPQIMTLPVDGEADFTWMPWLPGLGRRR